jgi:simple sugar transport system permease protein
VNDFLFAAVAQTTPILLAALAAMFTQRGNVLNVGVDGMMLGGAFTAIAVGQITGSVSMAVLSAVFCGLLGSLILGWVTFRLNANSLVAGLGLNLLAAGVTVFLLERVYKSPGGLRPETFPDLWTVGADWFEAVPVIGPALNGQSVIVYLAILAIPASILLLHNTPFGYALRAVGEDEHAASAAGISLWRTRLWSMLLRGLLGGLAGAQLSMATLHFFLPDMTGGRGFLGLAAMLFGGATPLGATGASFFFGAAGAAGDRLQGFDLPNQFVLALPYVAAIAALILARIGRPAWLPRRRRNRQVNK